MNDDIEYQCQFIALSRMLLFWSGPGRIDERSRQLDAIAKSILPGVGSQPSDGPSTQKVPHEILRDDYDAMLEVVQWVKKSKPQTVATCGSWWKVPAPEPIASKGLAYRFAYAPSTVDQQLINLRKGPDGPKANPPNEIATSWVKHRLAGDLKLSISTIRRAQEREGYDRDKVSDQHRFLASIFLDIAQAKNSHGLALLVLDALGTTYYPPLNLFYLVRRCRWDNVEAPSPVLRWFDDVRQYCFSILKQNDPDIGPSFRSWLTDKATT
ncbi:MAG: hypothetical protein AAGF10_00120 [Verrucomicrobiota bacterium]